MAMIVQHNLTAMNSNRMLGVNTKAQAKSTEKLSSGYKINRAADDAAGLSISEKMRKQIRGLTQASANAQDGISAVQTAEGALGEVQDMLQRMNELAVKAANGTQSENDKSYIQNEIDQLVTEIDRVAETTKFNETYLLKGDRDAVKKTRFSYGNDTAVTGSATFEKIAAETAPTLSVDDATASTKEINDFLVALKEQGFKYEEWTTDEDSNDTGELHQKLTLLGSAADKYEVVANGTANKYDVLTKDGKLLGTITVTPELDTEKANIGKKNEYVYTAKTIEAHATADDKAQYYDRDGNAIPENALDSYFTTNADGEVVAKADAPTVYDAVGNVTTLTAGDVSKTQDLTGDLQLSLHVGADATENNQITINLAAMSAKGLGINGLAVDGADDTNALKSIEVIKEAIQKVSTQRSALGAVQNRLEHTISNLDNVVENTTSAEAAIRDTDMANEMVRYSNGQILAQAGQAMLAQANQANQGVLSLLG